MTGRNDPCACGSGHKFKKCCLMGDQFQQTDSIEFQWRQARKTSQELTPKLMKFITQNYGEEALIEAWHEYHHWDDTPFDIESQEVAIFMPWFIFEWQPDLDDTVIVPGPHQDFRPAEAFLRQKGGYLSIQEREYLDAALLYPFSFYEVTRCSPGLMFTLKDIFTNEIFEIQERRGSEKTREGDILFAKPMRLKTLSLLEATSIVIIPPTHRNEIAKLRDSIFKVNPGRKAIELLKEYELEIREIYLALQESILNPPLPILQNTDGEKMLPQTLCYEIESVEATFESLKDMALDRTGEEILKDALYDKNGTPIKIEFPWLKSGNKRHKGWSNTILGHILIEKNRMQVKVNSKERASRFEKELKKRKINGVHYRTTLIEPLDSVIEEMWRKRGQSSPSDIEASRAETPPELAAVLKEVNQKHWQAWREIKIPALNNRTPIQASKTKKGKELLRALLLHYEHQAADRPQPGVSSEFFQELRKEFGVFD